MGATALGVASARATETESDNPLIIIRSRGCSSTPPAMECGTGTRLAAATELVEAIRCPAADAGDGRLHGFADKVLRQFFLDATGAGIRQAVILAAGLDSRSWRLPWPDGVTVYELDQPRVLDFKASTLTEHGAQPACNRVAAPVDLRGLAEGVAGGRF